MKKFVNLRTPVIFALAICIGIAAGIALYFYKLSIAWITLALAPAPIIIAIWALVNRKLLRPVLLVLLPLSFLIGGAFNSFYALKRYDNSEVTPDYEYRIQGIVKEMGDTSSGEYIIISDITADGRKIKGKAYVYLAPTYGELCDVGYTVDFIGVLDKFDSFQYGELNSFAEDNIKYMSSVFAGLKSSYGFALFGSIRTAIRDTLFDNLNHETAAVSYAMLTGNTQAISDESLESFRYGGVAHIFAVSGLHIGLVFGIFSFILKKFHANKYISAVISIGAILFYAAICGFTLSSVRATIMCTVSVIAGLLRERYDGLNSLAVAVIVILSFTPLSILSVGFQLSICAVGGIYCLSRYIAGLLKKIKVPKNAALTIGVSTGAQLGTMPIMLSNFGYLSTAGLLLNLIVLPVLSAEFTVLFCFTLLCIIVPPAASVLLPYAVLPLEFTMSVFINAGFEKSLISGFGAGAFVFLYFIGILALSDKINLSTAKRIFALVCSVVILANHVLIRLYSPLDGYRVIISAYNRGGEILIKSQYGSLLIVTDDANPSRLQSMLNRNYSGDIAALIILGDDGAYAYSELGINCDVVYIWNNLQIQPYGNIILNYEDDFSVCGVNCTFLDQNTLLADVDGIKLGICAGTNYFLERCDIFIADGISLTVEYDVQVFFNDRSATLNVFDCGDIKFQIYGGSYRLKN